MVCSIAHSQTFFSNKLEGKVSSKDGDVAATHVLNITRKKATITDVAGYFSIPVNLGDTLVFSAIQYKKKQIVVTATILESKTIHVLLEDALNQLDEVIVMPYNLSGNMGKDINRLKTEPVVTASTLDLPNAYVKSPTQAERKLFEATSGGGLVSLNLILNTITGRKKYLKRIVERDKKYGRTERVREFYLDSLYHKELKIPIAKIDDFMYFCETDAEFNRVVDTHDKLKIWEFLQTKSRVYRRNNNLK